MTHDQVQTPEVLDRRRLLQLATAGALLGSAGLVSACDSREQKQNFEIEIQYLVNGRLLLASVVQRLLYRRYVGGLPSGLYNDFGVTGEGAGVAIPGTSEVIVSTFYKLVTPTGTPGPFDGKMPLPSWSPAPPLVRGLTSNADLGRGAMARAVIDLKAPSSWVQMTLDDLPMIVRFTNAADPGSAEWIDLRREDESVRVVSSRMRLTKAPITRRRLDKLLTWIPRVRKEMQAPLGFPNERTVTSNLMTIESVSRIK